MVRNGTLEESKLESFQMSQTELSPNKHLSGGTTTRLSGEEPKQSFYSNSIRQFTT